MLLHALETVDALVDVCGDFLASKVSEDLWPLLKVRYCLSSSSFMLLLQVARHCCPSAFYVSDVWRIDSAAFHYTSRLRCTVRAVTALELPVPVASPLLETC